MTSEVEIVSILMFWHLLYFTVLPTSVRFENVASRSRLLGTEGQDLTMSCKAEGGTPAPNIILMIDGQTVASQIQSVQYTLHTINRSYDNKTVTCQASNPTYSQNTMTVSAVIYLNCKNLVFPVFSHIYSKYRHLLLLQQHLLLHVLSLFKLSAFQSFWIHMVKLFDSLIFIQDIGSSHMTKKYVFQWPLHFRVLFDICNFCGFQLIWPKGSCQLLLWLCVCWPLYNHQSSLITFHMLIIKTTGKLKPNCADIMFMRSSTNIHHFVFIHQLHCQHGKILVYLVLIGWMF
jgi:hypothetical protein